HSVTLHYGYGRPFAGKVGSNIGSNAYALRHTGAMAFGHGLRIEKTGRQVTLACTQFHHMLQDRAGREEAAARIPRLVRAATLEEIRKALAGEPGASDRHAADTWPHAEGAGPITPVGRQ